MIISWPWNTTSPHNIELNPMGYDVINLRPFFAHRLFMYLFNIYIRIEPNNSILKSAIILFHNF